MNCSLLLFLFILFFFRWPVRHLKPDQGPIHAPDDGKEILVRQITGAVAWRIITYAGESAEVLQGSKPGFVKFGSGVDVFLPVGTGIEVPILQQVRANRSIIARI